MTCQVNSDPIKRNPTINRNIPETTPVFLLYWKIEKDTKKLSQ
ncbi:MAG: hypothetical protein BAJATHORv1_10585 [Candidatus Thorarchaeota archaeon]|nr:MAG: hypothetical protein BAJATHORv1_10585 [Candidatus Thorarchaeota archaeon]